MVSDKDELRRVLRGRLRSLGEERGIWSRAVCVGVAAQRAYAAAEVVAIFDPLPSEPAVDLLWALAPRRFVYPRIAGEGLELIEVKSVAELARVEGRKFREPSGDGGTAHWLEEVDVILVPGLAFTRNGERLGRGGGYYDRLLAALSSKTVKIGVCFESQIVEELPTEAHDERMDLVITERTPSAKGALHISLGQSPRKPSANDQG